MSLPAELETLELQYAEFFASYQTGALSETDLRATAENLIAVDGNGSRWKLNLDGDGFLRAWPGGAFTPAYPEEFTPLSVPPTTPLDTSDAFSWQTPPGQPPAPRQPVYTPHEIDPKAPIYNQPATQGKAAKVVAKAGAMKTMWSAMPPKRRRIALVAGACALLLVAIVLRGGGTAPEDTTGGVDTTTAPAVSTTPTTQLQAPSTTAPVDSVTSEVLELATVRIQEVLTALTSGNRETIIAGMVNPGEPGDFWQKAATWSGMQHLGLIVDMSALPVYGENSAQQTWTIINSVDGAPVLTAQVDWVFNGLTWLPYTFPNVTGV